ncbi:coiled-coil domain-containing protein 170 [Strongylocentrotus purpuratus]|uniref:Coiled-coil domain-containing protein 170 n=1 Tax=Strongylocentrotus purpuratus TaxID=7668 RepID=A0A7M7PTD3_STRPU|nr:coiled-coil domain-containing protein 170 [Strongylocentrotus purpuratus]
MAYYSRDRVEDGLPRLSGGGGGRAADLRLLDDEIQRLVHNRSAPPSGSPNTPSYASPMQSRKLVQDLHEQVKLYKTEAEKKDKLIQDLSRGDILAHRKHVAFEDKSSRMYSDSILSSKLSQLKFQAEAAPKRDLAILHLKNEQLETELAEAQAKIAARELQLKEVSSQLEHQQSDAAQHLAIIQSLRDRVGDLSNQSGVLEGAHARGGYTIDALQKESSAQAERILELEARIRDLTTEREDSEQKSRMVQRKFDEVFLQLRGAIKLESDSPEKMLDKVNDLAQENIMLRGRLSTLNEALNGSELESKASRETIQRLVGEIEREQKTYVEKATSVEKLKMERDIATRDRNHLDAENRSLRERLDASQSMWSNRKQELEEREARLSHLSKEFKTIEFDSQVAKTELKSFKESLALLLSEGTSNCQLHDDVIKERIKALQIASRENNTHVDALGGKVRQLSEQLESQANLHQAAIRRAREAEGCFDDYKDRVRTLEGGLASSDALRDNLRTERQKYMAFLERLANVMNMDAVCKDVGFDMNGEALLARAEQLASREGGVLADKNTHVYTLQRKVKTLKQQLESKDLHLDLMRKKVANLEEGVMGRSNIQKDKEEMEWSYKKLGNENDRLRSELARAKKIVVELKAEMMDVSNIKLSSMHQNATIEELQKIVEKLEKIKEKQARKLAGMKQELDFTEHEANETKVRSEHSMGSMTEELHATKLLLSDIQRRDQQLTDFRQVIARMLGMDVAVLAVPDYEIIARLEKVIQAHHSHAITSLGMENTLTDMERGFKQGYHESSTLLAGNTRMSRSGTRTLSPTRKKVVRTEVY